TGTDKEQLIEEGSRSGHDAGPREVSQEEREGVPPTDTSPGSPHGVGESRGSQGNEQMLGESNEARRQDRLETGVSRSQPIDPESPNLHSGDQGG
ncbi:MAG: hypothetical protein LC799_21735, partial [Actinobacteria bacterium]|nr:hypothetical protein [Actinomycetota bacterium]